MIAERVITLFIIALLAKESNCLEFDKLVRGKYNPKYFDYSWVSGNELLYQDDQDDVILYNVDTNQKDVLCSIKNLEGLLVPPVRLQLSPGRTFLLIADQIQKLYTYSFDAIYHVYDINAKILHTLSPEKYQNAIWAPIVDSIVFVYNSDIFMIPDVTKLNDYRQLSNKENSISIFHGVPDWVYEVEVLKSNQAFWFSPDGKYLAYLKIDDTNVPFMPIPVYGSMTGMKSDGTFEYPTTYWYKYPKVGQNNPIVSLRLVDLQNLQEEITPADLPAPEQFKEPILTAVAWANDHVINAIWMNRVQNEAYLLSYDANEPGKYRIVSHFKEPNGWLELFTPPMFSADGRKLLLILSQEQNDVDGAYKHLVRIDNTESGATEALTKGKFVVTKILGWHEKHDVIYYEATTAHDSGIRHIYSIKTSSLEISCLSCNLKSSLSDSHCLFNSASFSTDASHSLIYCKGPGTPTSFVLEGDKVLRPFDVNQVLHDLVAAENVPATEIIDVHLDNNLKTKVLLKLPNMEEGKQYPMILRVNNKPNTLEATNEFRTDWCSYLAAEKGIICATIDGRLAGLRGDRFQFSIYKKLGQIDIEDFRLAVKQIKEHLQSRYIVSKTAIWGWGFGGHAAGMAIATDTEGIFQCGIAVAPVTDLTIHNSIFTERIMGLQTDSDGAGYNFANVMLQVDEFKDMSYLWLHGTMDFDIHYQHSMALSAALIGKGKHYVEMSYTDQSHELDETLPHFYHKQEEFLEACFKHPKP